MSRPIKVTPALVKRMHELRAQGLKHRQVGAELEVAAETVRKALAGRHGNSFIPAGKTACKPQSPTARHAGASPAPRSAPKAQKQEGPDVQQHAEADPPARSETNPEDPTMMLLQNQSLSLEARQHFGLPRSPFVDDVATPDDVFQTPSVRYVRAALTDCANHHGFVAVVGESGAGKSTLAEDLEERIKGEGREIAVIRPYVLAMEQSDAKGKTLKASHIAEAIAAALDPQLKVKSSPEARFAQVHALLKASRRAGRRHLLLIEEAHCLPTATLKHLKRFLELKDGMQRLLGVALIAQPELRDRLNSQNGEVREVMQRCELVELSPLDAELEGYLRHKFARFELRFEDVFAPCAVDAIRARLVHVPRGGKVTDARSICHPLVVNNLVARAMNAAARAAWPKVDAQVIAGC
jgi:type II secretory pathway predicted ATPase ExeA